MNQILCLTVPLVAILLSFITKRVHLSLGIGIFFGFCLLEYIPQFSALETSKTLLYTVLLNIDNIKIIVFTSLISLMVSLMIYNGSITLIAKYLAKLAYDRKSAQLTTWITGLVIFFDDYANTLIVGNTLRPITDRYRVSREKLAYIVDSTAAPVAAIALISTWIGTEVREINEALGENIVGSPYSYFLNSLSYSYYPILTLAFILITILTNREFGPMLRTKSKISTVFVLRQKTTNTKLDLFIAVLPILLLLGSSVAYMIYSGYQKLGYWDLRLLIAESDSYNSLLIGSILSFIAANIFTNKEHFDKKYFYALKDGLKKITEPLSILVLAWSLGHIISSLETATCILNILPEDTTPYALPSIIFLLSALISFATGSSFSTMGIVYPIALPIVLTVCQQTTGISAYTSNEIMYHAIASVLAGAVFGDHCSPISDTTVLSSLSCECNHLQHVRTQLPYAVVVGTVSVFLSFTVANMDLPAPLVMGLGVFILYMVINVFGRTVR